MTPKTSSPDNDSRHTCLTCSRSFKNKNHLRRHEVSHTHRTTHRCEGCARDFARHDALRRHVKTCTKVNRDNAEVLPSRPRGRRQRACDACKSRKLRCDGENPCERCSMSKTVCIYSLADDPSPKPSHVPMTFLLEYTNPVLNSVSDAFAISGAHGESVNVLDGHLFASTSYVNDALLEDLFSDIFAGAHEDPPASISDGPSKFSVYTPSSSLHHRTDELVSLLEAQYKTSPLMFPLLVEEFPTELGRVVFSSNNITSNASAFFACFHPHTPFLHQPSIDLDTVPSHLLLAISLLGSVFATPTDDALSARCFFSLAEEYIFGLLQRLISRTSSCNDDDIGLVQSAVLMHALQVDSNHEGVRHRVRVHRFPEIVAAVRKLGLFNLTCLRPDESSRWENYIHDEVRIRLATRVFLTDCMSTLYFKSPPQITLSEMRTSIPSADDVFDAQNPTDFIKLTSLAKSSEPRRQNVQCLVQLFLQDGWDGPDASSLANLESEHLILFIFALHSIIFNCRTGLVLASTNSVLLRAIARWKDVWQKVQTRETAKGKVLVGFAKYGLELWWLAQKILERAQAGDKQSAYMTGAVTDSLEELHDFIQVHASQVEV